MRFNERPRQAKRLKSFITDVTEHVKIGIAVIALRTKGKIGTDLIKRSHMSRKWAEKYPEYIKHYYRMNGTCENPRCGHWPIHYRFVLQNPETGEKREV